MNRTLLRFLGIASLAAAISGCGQVSTSSIDRFRQSGELIALSGGQAGASNACFTCHGLDGSGNGAGAPRLAGLHPGYLERQLQAYADGRRRHPEMEWIARRLSPRDRRWVSGFYGALSFEAPGAASIHQGEGHRLYVRGDPDRNIPPCAECHGLQGQGLGPANPALAGQPESYLREQLEKWRRSERRTDPGNVMQYISRKLTPRQAAAVSAYAAALPGDPRHRESPAASREERRGGPRSDASAQLRHAPEPVPPAG